MEELVLKFEAWYYNTYWDFQNHGVIYNKETNSYNHVDVDLAWNAFYEGFFAGKWRH